MSSSKKQNQTTDSQKNETVQAQNPENQQTEITGHSDAIQNSGDNAEKESSTGGKQPVDDKAENPAQKENGADDKNKNEDAANKTVKMVLRHKSHTPHYHRCGLTLTKVFAEYDVPSESIGKIKADKWIDVKESK